METWNDRLRKAREAKRINKSKFAKLVGVSAPTVTEWESGKIKDLKAENARRACEVLDITVSELMRGPKSKETTRTPLALPSPLLPLPAPDAHGKAGSTPHDASMECLETLHEWMPADSEQRAEIARQISRYLTADSAEKRTEIARVIAVMAKKEYTERTPPLVTECVLKKTNEEIVPYTERTGLPDRRQPGPSMPVTLRRRRNDTLKP